MVGGTGDQGETAERLHEQHQELRRRLADVADHSAEVHEQLAEVHEDLPGRLLDPEDLREHAARDRRLAAEERAALEEGQP